MSIIKTKSFTLAAYEKGDKEASKLALVLPGKLDTKDYADMRGHVDFLGKRGFHAVSFDPPGTWESPGDISLYTMTNYLRAIDELILYLGNKPTFLLGHSRGGRMAMIAGARNPLVTAFAAVMSSFVGRGYQESADEEWKKTRYAIVKRDLPPGGGPKVKEFRLPYSFLLDQQKYTMTDDIAHTAKPKLFIMGAKDFIAPPEKVQETFAVFADPKEIFEVSSGHDYRFDPDIIAQINQRIALFLDL